MSKRHQLSAAFISMRSIAQLSNTTDRPREPGTVPGTTFAIAPAPYFFVQGSYENLCSKFFHNSSISQSWFALSFAMIPGQLFRWVPLGDLRIPLNFRATCSKERDYFNTSTVLICDRFCLAFFDRISKRPFSFHASRLC